MIPLIYVAATLPLFITSVVFAFMHLFMPLSIDPALSSTISTIGLFYFIVMVVLSLLVPALRGTYGDRVGQVIMAVSVALLYLGGTVYRPWNWLWFALWVGFIALDVWLVRHFWRTAGMTPDEYYSLDSLSRRLPGVRW